MFLFIIYEGNIEKFSFYFFSECQNLFSRNFAHKMSNLAMILLFFPVVLFSVAGLVWAKQHYKKLAKYFLEDSEKTSL